jgi:outer membrane protein assembly factor BamB
VAVVDGVVAVMGYGAFSAKDGTKLYKFDGDKGECTASPSIWQTTDADGKPKTYFVLEIDRSIKCINPADGKVVWHYEGKQSHYSASGTLAIVGDYCVMACPSQLLKLSPTGASLVCALPDMGDPGDNETSATAVYKEHIYTLIDGNMSCCDLTGKILWQQDLGERRKISSPLIVNGKFIVSSYKGVTMCAATPEKPKFYTAPSLPSSIYASACYGEGKLLLRQVDCIACYNLMDEKQNVPAVSSANVAVAEPASASSAVSGANLALNKPVTASSVYWEEKDPKAAPKKAVDGDISTRFTPKSGGGPDSLIIDLQATYSVDRFIVVTGEEHPPRGREISVSTDSNAWTKVLAFRRVSCGPGSG